MNTKSLVYKTKKTLKKHSPEIITGIGVASMLLGTVLAVKATPKAIELINDKKKEDGVDELPIKDIVKTSWKCYISASLSTFAGISLIVGANTLSGRRNAALATAYGLSEKAFSEYKEKVKETIGEKKEKKVRDEIIQDHINTTPPPQTIILGDDEVLYFDAHSGRYFKSTAVKIESYRNSLNEALLKQDNVSLSDWYDLIGLEHTSDSDNIGWNLMTQGLVELDLAPKISQDGRPCVAIGYTVEPRYDFWKMG